MNRLIKCSAILFLFCVFSFHAQAQNIAINSSGNSGNAAAILDLSDASNSSLGLALPNVSIVNVNSANPIVTPPAGLIVYNTNAATVGGLGVGFYYWSGAVWNYVQNSGNSTSWQIAGNSNILDGTNFIGTTNNVPINFQINGQKAGRIDAINNNTFLGNLSGNATTAITTGADNSGFGYEALFSNTFGTNNAAFGNQALYTNTNGSGNAAIGTQALYLNTSGNNNTAVGGSGTMLENTTGGNNTALGAQALYNNNTASSNTAIGTFAGYNNNTGDFNTFIGDSAGFLNTSATGTTFVGYGAGVGNTTGSNNTAIGNAALTSNFTGTNLTAIGYQANVNADGYFNSTAIGFGAIIGQSDAIILGNSSARTGIQTSTPGQALEIGGSSNTIRIDGLQFGNTFNTPPLAITTYMLYANNNGDIYAMPAAGGLGNVLAWTPSGPAWETLPAGAISANNGLNISAGNNVQLGGNLVAATTITNNGNALSITGSLITTTVLSSGLVGVNQATPLTTFDMNGGFSTEASSTIPALTTIVPTTITVGNNSYIEFTSNSISALDRPFTLSAGTQTGQHLTLELNSPTTSGASLVSGGNVSLLNSPLVFGEGSGNSTVQSVELIWNGSAWIDAAPKTSLATTIFTYTGAVQTWTAPANVTAITVRMWGGGGAGCSTFNGGGAGAYIYGALTVTPGSTYTIVVGSGGTINATSPLGGGGTGTSGDAAGGGGGFSGIFSAAAAQGTALVVVGGGGGGAANNGNVGIVFGGGGGAPNGGAGGNANNTCATETGGGGGTTVAGGTAGADPCLSDVGLVGTALQGGNKGATKNKDFGGGGGGGFWGGGSGGCNSGSGGGGGSSYTTNANFALITNTAGSTGSTVNVMPGGTNDPYYLQGIGVGAVSTVPGGNGLVIIQY